MRLKSQTVLFTLALAFQAQAMSFITTNAYTVAQDTILTDEQWVYTADAEMNGLAKDDFFILSGNHLGLGGTFEHNVWGVGGMVDLSGNAQRNVRLMGKTVQVKGSVGGNVLALGDTVKITPDASIAGSAKLIGNNIIIEGTTKGDVSITASRVATLSGTIEGSVNIIAPEIILQRNTRIGGNLTYTTSKELVPGEGIVVGTLNRATPQSPPAFSKTRMLSRVMWFFAALLAGIPFITLFPMTSAMASQFLRTSPWKCLWVGVLCAIALPLFGIMSISSFIGIPLGALILGSWAFLVYTSQIIMGLVIGTFVLRSKNTSIGHILLAMVTGLAIIYTATSIPAISWSIQLLIISMGTGALLLSLFQKRRLIIQVPQDLKQLKESKTQEPNHEEEAP